MAQAQCQYFKAFLYRSSIQNKLYFIAKKFQIIKVIFHQMWKKDQKGAKGNNAVKVNNEQIIEQIFIDEELDKIRKKYEYPASFKKAKLHNKAVKFGYNALKVKKDTGLQSNINTPTDTSRPVYQRPKLCACCNQPINTQSIKICYSTTSPQTQTKPFLLNSSTSMFFSFIKMAIIYLLIVFLVCGIFNLFTSIDGNYCVKHTKLCEKNIFEMISAYNKYLDKSKSEMLKIENILSLCVVVLSIIFFIIYRKIQYDIYQEIDAQQQTQDDFTIFVQNVPILDFKDNIDTQDVQAIEFDYEQRLKEIFQQEIKEWLSWMNGNQSNLDGTIQTDLLEGLNQKQKTISDLESGNKITTVTLCFDLTQLQKVQQRRQDLIQSQIAANGFSLTSFMTSGNNRPNPQNTQKQIQVLNKIQLNMCQKYALDNSPSFNISHFVGKAFVSFEYQHFRQYIMQKYEDGSKKFMYGNNELVLSRATHPTDICWVNMKIDDFDRLKKIISSYLIISMVLIFSAFALVGVDFIKLSGIKEGENLGPETVAFNYGLNILTSVITSVINIGIGYLVTQLTEFERHKTITNKYSSVIIKSLITQFINTAFIFYLIQVLNNRPYLSSAGLVVQVSFLIVVSGFISILVNTLNFPYIMRMAILWYKYGYTSYQSMKHVQVPTFQIYLNKDFEQPIFDITSRYSYYLLNIYACMFYAYLVPVGVLAVAVIFGIQYWIDKIKLFKLSSEYHEINYQLSRVILKMFEGSVFAFALGNLLFGTVLDQNHKVSIISIISLVIAFVYVCFIAFAPAELQRKFFAKYEKFEKQSYTQCISNHKFNETYWVQNPATVFIKEIDINDQNRWIHQGSAVQYFDVNDIVGEAFQMEEEQIGGSHMPNDGNQFNQKMEQNWQ